MMIDFEFDLSNVLPQWKLFLEQELNCSDYDFLKSSMKFDCEEGTILYPKFDKIFEAFRYFDLDQTKVVILGMDPYINEGQAMGLSFSVPPNVKIPPSLKNIYKEIETDLALDISHRTGDLTDWTKQGVLLLNSILTVQKGFSGSHKGLGWQKLTDAVISKLNELNKPIVYLLWGNYAKEKGSLITNKKQLVLRASHPSPFSASNGFFGCKHFSKTNEFLIKNSEKEIDWVGEKL
jgi:uracil-DNA glycosylase